jgi:hypothetical protein
MLNETGLEIVRFSLSTDSDDHARLSRPRETFKMPVAACDALVFVLVCVICNCFEFLFCESFPR